MNIIFTCALGKEIEEVLDKPKPASEFLPEWYKKANAYLGDNKRIPAMNGKSAGTIKKCMPVFDAITAGYIITTPTDIYVRQVDGAPYYNWAGFDALDFHIVEQTQNHPMKKDGNDSPKFMNPWEITTPKGYSILITQPMHRDSIFTIMPGIVDSDTYHRPVNFPFLLNDLSFEGMIPCGTPVAQIIPFKRESWKMTFGGKKELKKINVAMHKFDTVFWDRYKRFWWHKKEYK